MFDSAMLSVSGNVVANPNVSGEPTNPDRATFRVVSNRRRRDPNSGEWIDAGEYAVNVVCWRKLARGVVNSVRRGDPVHVTGRIATREYTDQDGNRRWMTEVTADYVGLDLNKGVSANFIRFNRLDRLADRSGDAGAGDATEVADAVTGTDDRPGDADGFGADALDAFESPDPELSTV